MHRIVRAWQSRDTRGAITRLELCLTPCIVSHPPGACDALLNPANERLDGTQFDPSTAARTFESTIIYPTQVVDGLVTELGGHTLYRTLQALPRGTDGSRCATGHALSTPSGGELACAYPHLVHAVPPFYAAPRWEAQLGACWHAAFAVADAQGFRVLAAPLMGAGARGAPVEVAATVAARAAVTWRGGGGGGGGGGGSGSAAQLQTLRFAVQEVEVAAALGGALEAAVRGSAGAFLQATTTTITL